MNVPTRLVGFAAALGLAFGGAALAGAAIDPTDERAAADAGHGEAKGAAAGHGKAKPADAKHGEAKPADADRDAHGDGAATAKTPAHAGTGPAASGLAVSDGGYGFEIDRRFFNAGQAAPFTFRITDERGRVLRDEYELEHDKELHLIVVRRDTAIFKHVHPRKRRDGSWSVDLNLREPGAYRAYADFKIGGRQRTVATDLFVPGNFQPKRLPAPESVDQAVDDSGRSAGDLDVKLEAPGVRAGREAPLSFAVTRRGRPFERLQPYLGAKGHLVALREGDLAYLHVHPKEDANENEVPFMATFPTAGRYRLFLQFKAGGEVRTVDYTLEVPR